MSVGLQRGNVEPSGLTNDPTKIFKVEASQLQELFNKETSLKERLTRLTYLQGFDNKTKEQRGIDGLLEKLQTDATSGIMGDKADLQRREGNFGKNEKPERAPTPYWNSFKEGICIPVFYALGICAAISMITGMIYDPKTGWLEGVSIFIVVAIMVLIDSLNDWIQDSRFAELQSRAAEQELPVFRGKHSEMQTVSMWKLLVGDVVLLSVGDIVPADCIIVRSDRFSVIAKGALEHSSSADERGAQNPFLFDGEQVVRGNCTAVVAAVGRKTERDYSPKSFDPPKTELQKKTKNLASVFNLITFISAGVILVTAIIIQIIQTAANPEIGGKIFVKKFMQNITLCIVLIIACMPDGLPVCVDLSLAHSTRHMDVNEDILVRNLDAPEKLGKITEICTGLTGTLTETDFAVGKLFSQTRMVKNSRRDTLTHCQLTGQVIDLITESIMWNSECHMELTKEAMYSPKGNDTECAFLRWLQDAEVDVHRHCLARQSLERVRIPFDSFEKRSIVAVQHPSLHETIRVFVKGAPEVVLASCSSEFSDSGEKVPMEQDRIGDIQSRVNSSMSAKAQRAIAFSYKDMSIEEFEGLRSETSDFDSIESPKMLAADQTLIAIISLKQPIRDDVKLALARAERGGVNVRIVTNNSPQTAYSQALTAGLIKDKKDDQPSAKKIMLAKEFTEQCGGLKEDFVDDPDFEAEDAEANVPQIKKFSPVDQNKFDQLIQDVKIIARATPNDKLLIVSGLANSSAVGVIGDGNSDIKAFKAASVSLCMGTGTCMAQKQADIVLRDDQFSDSIKAIMFGRNIYSNIKRFLQFQITCMFTLIITMFVGYCYFTEAPINSTQLLWINLVMDTFAAIALATMPPLETVLSEPVTSQDTQVLTKAVWRQIYGVTLWNVAVMCIMIFAGKRMFDLDYSTATQTTERVDGKLTAGAIAKRTHLTIIFNTFVQLAWFNEWNCRVIRPQDYNILTEMFLFKKPYSGWYFLSVMIFTAAFQWMAVNFGMVNWLFESQNLSAQDYFRSVAWGSSVIPVALLLKFTPNSWMDKLPVGINENRQFENKYMSLVQDNMKGKKGTKLPAGSISDSMAAQANAACAEGQPLDENTDDHFKQA